MRRTGLLLSLCKIGKRSSEKKLPGSSTQQSNLIQVASTSTSSSDVIAAVTTTYRQEENNCIECIVLYKEWLRTSEGDETSCHVMTCDSMRCEELWCDINSRMSATSALMMILMVSI